MDEDKITQSEISKASDVGDIEGQTGLSGSKAISGSKSEIQGRGEKKNIDCVECCGKWAIMNDQYWPVSDWAVLDLI